MARPPPRSHAERSRFAVELMAEQRRVATAAKASARAPATPPARNRHTPPAASAAGSPTTAAAATIVDVAATAMEGGEDELVSIESDEALPYDQVDLEEYIPGRSVRAATLSAEDFDTARIEAIAELYDYVMSYDLRTHGQFLFPARLRRNLHYLNRSIAPGLGTSGTGPLREGERAGDLNNILAPGRIADDLFKIQPSKPRPAAARKDDDSVSIKDESGMDDEWVGTARDWMDCLRWINRRIVGVNRFGNDTNTVTNRREWGFETLRLRYVVRRGKNARGQRWNMLHPAQSDHINRTLLGLGDQRLTDDDDDDDDEESDNGGGGGGGSGDSPHLPSSPPEFLGGGGNGSTLGTPDDEGTQSPQGSGFGNRNGSQNGSNNNNGGGACNQQPHGNYNCGAHGRQWIADAVQEAHDAFARTVRDADRNIQLTMIERLNLHLGQMRTDAGRYLHRLTDLARVVRNDGTDDDIIAKAEFLRALRRGPNVGGDEAAAGNAGNGGAANSRRRESGGPRKVDRRQEDDGQGGQQQQDDEVVDDGLQQDDELQQDEEPQQDDEDVEDELQSSPRRRQRENTPQRADRMSRIRANLQRLGMGDRTSAVRALYDLLREHTQEGENGAVADIRDLLNRFDQSFIAPPGEAADPMAPGVLRDLEVTIRNRVHNAILGLAREIANGYFGFREEDGDDGDEDGDGQGGADDDEGGDGEDGADDDDEQQQGGGDDDDDDDDDEDEDDQGGADDDDDDEYDDNQGGADDDDDQQQDGGEGEGGSDDEQPDNNTPAPPEDNDESDVDSPSLSRPLTRIERARIIADQEQRTAARQRAEQEQSNPRTQRQPPVEAPPPEGEDPDATQVICSFEDICRGYEPAIMMRSCGSGRPGCHHMAHIACIKAYYGDKRRTRYTCPQCEEDEEGDGDGGNAHGVGKKGKGKRPRSENGGGASEPPRKKRKP